MCVVFGPLLNFEEAVPHVRKGGFEFALHIASNDHFHVVLFDEVHNVVLLVDVRKGFELFPCEVHQKLDLFLCSVVVLEGEGVERSVLDSQVQAVEQTFFEGVGSFLMAGERLIVLGFAESPVSVHDESNVLGDVALFQHIQPEFFY